MSEAVDITEVEVPEDTPPTEYHYTERRAAILQLMESGGVPPREVNQSKLARIYDVSQPQIHKDLKWLHKHADIGFDPATAPRHIGDIEDVADLSWGRARELTLERDGYACRFCGLTNEAHKDEYDGEGLHAHHVLPEKDGGTDHPDNLLTVCQRCHATLEHTHAVAVSQLRERGLYRG